MSGGKPVKTRSRDARHNREQRNPSSMLRFQSLVDERIAAAQNAGVFDNLPGAGKPLPLDDDSLTPAEDRAAYRVLKQAGFSPPWVELRNRIRAEQESFAAWMARTARQRDKADVEERQRLRAECQERVAAINRLIIDHNLIAPPVVGQLPLMQLWRELHRLEAE